MLARKKLQLEWRLARLLLNSEAEGNGSLLTNQYKIHGPESWFKCRSNRRMKTMVRAPMIGKVKNQSIRWTLP